MKNILQTFKYQIFIKNICLSFLLIYCLNCCDNKYDYLNTIHSIDIEKALNDLKFHFPFELFNEIEFIQLETDKQCIISDFPRYFFDDEFIVSYSFRKIQLFYRNTGKYYKEIGEYNKGPNGYRYTMATIAYNEENKIIYAGDWDNNYCGYNYNNKKIVRIRTPYNFINSVGYINDSTFIGFIGSNQGGKEKKLVAFDINGEIIKLFPNFLPYNQSDHFHFNAWEGIFFRSDGKLNFKEIYNDTLFQVNTDTLIPRYFFNMGNYSPVPEKRSELEEIITIDELGNVTWELDDYVETKTICESFRYLFFEFKFHKKEYWGYYDKKTGNTQLKLNEDNITINGIEIPFRLTRAYIYQKNQELITYIDAYKIVSWFKNNPEKAANLPPHLQKLRNIKENDNPVVMITKLKK